MNTTKMGVECWGPMKFLRYFICLCEKNDVAVDVKPEEFHPKYIRAMSDVIERVEKRGLSREDLADLLENLVAGWNGPERYWELFKSRFKWSGGKSLSMFLIKRHLNVWIHLCGYGEETDGAEETGETDTGRPQVDNCNAWGGPRFYRYVVDLCDYHGVAIADDVEGAIKYVPRRYSKAMAEVIKEAEKNYFSKKQLAELLERFIAGWSDGFSKQFTMRYRWRDGDFSIFLIRDWFDEVVKITDFDETEVKKPRLNIPKGTVEDLVK